MARDPADVALEKADWDAEYAWDLEFHKAMWGVATGAIDRAGSAAQLVQGAGAAIATIYTGLLGLIFSADGRPLPARAVMPVFMIGLSIACAMGYLAYIRRPGATPAPNWTSSNRQNQLERTRFFVQWTTNTVMQRAHFLRASVLFLGLGVLFLPAPFLAVTSGATSAAASKPSGAEVKTLAVEVQRAETLSLAQDPEDPTGLPSPSGFAKPSPSPRPARTRTPARTVTVTPPPVVVPAPAPVAVGFRLPEPVIWAAFLIGLALGGFTLSWHPEAKELRREKELHDFWYRPARPDEYIQSKGRPD